MTKEISIPDIGTEDSVEVIEVCVSIGDTIEPEQTLIVLESDKASMEIPAPMAGTIESIAVEEGQQVKQGDLMLSVVAAADEQARSSEEADTEINAQPTAAEPKQESAPVSEQISEPQVQGESIVIDINLPDIGTDEAVDIVEIVAETGTSVEQEDVLLVLESDKASMEIPSPSAGEVTNWLVKQGDQVKTGTLICQITTTAVPQASQVELAPEKTEQASAPQPPKQVADTPKSTGVIENRPSQMVYAGPAVRMLARELGVDLARVTSTGPRGRILKEDVHQYVKEKIKIAQSGAQGGSALPAVPEVDFSQWGEVSVEPLSKLDKLTAANMVRSWLNVPHVTQFDKLNVQELEEFRGSLKAQAEKKGVKLTPLPFIFKALASALKDNPKFNASLHADGERLVYKHYIHIGMAVDTPNGLVVPVIKNVDQKNIWMLAEEISEMASKARDRKLRPDDMKGGCFTVSSLGSIGGTGFTPIINTPEVGILGISKMNIEPVWDPESQSFVPEKMLPIALSYDHRVINGADAGRFLQQFSHLIADLRHLALVS